MLSELKSFTPQRLETEELIALSAFGRQLEAEYSALNVEAPEWVGQQLKVLRREVKTRNADAIQNKLRSAKARRETLLTPDQKRDKLDAEIAELEKQAAEV